MTAAAFLGGSSSRPIAAARAVPATSAFTPLSARPASVTSISSKLWPAPRAIGPTFNIACPSSSTLVFDEAPMVTNLSMISAVWFVSNPNWLIVFVMICAARSNEIISAPAKLMISPVILMVVLAS